MGCSKKSDLIQVIPGKGLAGVELGMTGEKLTSILGEPNSIYNKENIDKLGVIYDITPDGQSEKKSLEGMENIKLLLYKKPPLGVLIKDNKVFRLSLSYYEKVSVKGYPFLKFRYLTQAEYDLLGKPTRLYRNKPVEEDMISKAPQGTIYEYYDCNYDSIGLWLGLVFDKTKEKKSKYFIGVNYIDVVSKK